MIQEDQGDEALESLVEELHRLPFGPTFFLSQLRALVRDRCPSPAEGLPTVRLHLHSGDALDLCHVIGLCPTWAALAVQDASHGMRTELIPYASIVRVTICAADSECGHIGFDHTRPVKMMGDTTPEEVLRAVASPPPPP